MKSNDQKGITKIHNLRFYNLTPRSINCLAYNKRIGKLALSRDDASLEIWDLNHAPYLEKSAPGNNELTIEALGWSGDRLFSCGLTGVIEYNLSTLEKFYTKTVTGTFSWCLDISKQENLLAVGTEDGFLNLFEIVENELNYKTLFDKQEGRILCCKFDATGDYIVTGSFDVIRIWNTKTGNAIHKMTLSRIQAKRETIVWSLQVLNDFSIISVDSRGFLTVWDGKLGSQIQSIQISKAAVVSVVVNDDENIICAAGIDAVVSILSLTTIKKDEQFTTKKWVKFLRNRLHDFDIKALACCANNKVISGGIDGYLGISSFSKFNQDTNKYGPFLQQPCVSVSTFSRLVLLRYKNHLELWRLGKAANKEQFNDDENDSRKFLMLEKGSEKLIQLVAYNNEQILCSAISPNGSTLVYSTSSAARIFSLINESQDEKPKLIRNKDLPEQFDVCNQIVFSSDSKQLFLIKLKNQIEVFKILQSGDIDYVETIDASKSIKEIIHLATISPCGIYFIVAGTCRTISIWTKRSIKGHWQHHIKLPKYVALTTAISVHYNRPNLVATFTDGKIFEYDLEEMRFICTTKEYYVPEMKSHCIIGIVLDPRNENAVILYNDEFLFTLIKNTNDEENINSNSKIQKIEEQSSKNKINWQLKFVKKYEHLIHVSRLTEDEMVLVEVNPLSLIDQLPVGVEVKKFGVS